MENAWLINEPAKRRYRRRKRKEVKSMARRRRRKASPKRRYRRNDPGPRRRRRTYARRHYRRNDPGRRYYRRRYRRNDPDPAIMDIVYAGAGFIGTKFVGNMVTPAIGIHSPMARLAVKGAIAYVGGKFVVGKFIGRKAGDMFLVGGLVEVISDVVKSFVAPSIPALAAYEEPLQIEDAGAYEELDAYPELEGVDEEEEVYG